MRQGRKARQADTAPKRKVDYRNLKNPFPPMRAFSDDHIAKMHEAALDDAVEALERNNCSRVARKLRALLPAAPEPAQETCPTCGSPNIEEFTPDRTTHECRDCGEWIDAAQGPQGGGDA